MSNPDSAYYVGDSQIQASSERNPAIYARIQSYDFWMPAQGDSSPWIQADLGRRVNIYGLKTQGGGANFWVEALTVSTFQALPGEGDSGDFIQDGNGKVKVI